MTTPKKGPYNVILGDSNGNWLNGSFALDDAIYGRGGNDHLFGFHGDDSLFGGDGRDYLSGSSGRDSLYGGDGNDYLYGGTENDYLRGGAGGDRLDGGSGTDTVSYFNSAAGVFIDLVNNVGYGGDADGDSFYSIENVTGSSHDDSIYGTNSDNVISGLSGSDWLYGLGGDDTLIGGDGTNHLYGGTGTDTVSYADSDAVHIIKLNEKEGFAVGSNDVDIYDSIENVIGSDNYDYIRGDSQANVIDGRGGGDTIVDGAGDDTIYAGAGNDKLFAGSGADEYFGGDGTDRIDFHHGTVGVTVDLASGVGSGGDAEGDTYDGIEEVRASHYGDSLIGDNGDNVLIGNGGEDVIRGGGGDDILHGGMYVQADGFRDTFVFNDTQGSEADVIMDFEVGTDQIMFDGTDFFGFADLTNGGDRYMEQVGEDTVIHYYDHTITLRDVAANELSADDFLFT